MELDELDQLLHDHGLYNKTVSAKIKSLLHIHCVEDLASCTEEQINAIPFCRMDYETGKVKID